MNIEQMKAAWEMHSELVETIRCGQRGNETLMSQRDFEKAVSDLSGWKPASDAPKDGTDVWAAFKGQFGWVMFTARCTPHNGVYAAGYAPATHYRPLPMPPSE